MKDSKLGVLLILVIILSSIILFQCQRKSTKVIDRESEKESIKCIFKTLKNFMGTENMALFPEVFSKQDLLVISTNGPRHEGYNNFKSAVEMMFSSYDDGKTEIGEPKNLVIFVHPSGEIAGWPTIFFGKAL